MHADQIQIHWQPIYNVQTEEPIGYEALARVSGVANIGDWLQSLPPPESIRWDRRLRQAAFADAPKDGLLFINLTGATIQALGGSSPPVITAGGIDPKRLVFELPEGPWEASADLIRAAMPAGATYALDDVGGHSHGELGRLANLRPPWCKLDRDLVAGVARDRGRQGIITGLLHAALRMGTQLIAEGVENAEDNVCMRYLGVLYSQGYFWARPAPASEWRQAAGGVGL